MFKIIKIIALSVAILVITLLAGLYFSLDYIVSSGITSLGSRMTGTKVELQSIRISPFSGSIELRGLVVANPEGYHSKNAFAMGRFHLDMNVRSIFTNEIVINNVIIEDMTVDYELSIAGRSSNLQDIKNNISKFSRKKEDAAPAPAQSDNQKPGKKVVIRYLAIKNGTISLSSSLLNNSIKIQMPPVEMRDIGTGGNESYGTVVLEIYKKVLDIILSSLSRVDGFNPGQINLENISNAPEKLGNDLKDGLNSIKSSLGL